jgi:hypothetical protein
LNRAGTNREQIMAKERKKRSWKSHLARLLVVLLIGVIASELILRFVLGLGHPLLYSADANCSYLPAPDQHLYRFFAHNDINSQSMRSEPVQAAKSPDGIRILFVGDSVTYGQTYVDQAKIFTSILSRELPGQLHRPVEVLNASAGGWAVGNELGYIRSKGTFDADLVVFVINTYDMTQAFNDARPGSELAFAAHNPPCAIAEAWTRYLKPRLFHQSDADRGSTMPATGGSQEISDTMRQIDDARALAMKNHSRFAIAYSPVVDVATGAFVPLHQKAFPILQKWADGANVPLLDLESAYTAASVKKVYNGEIHLSPDGNGVVAKTIEQWPLIREYDRAKAGK